MKLGALGLPAYRTFSLEELEDATNNFDTTAFMGEGSQGQVSDMVNIYLILLPCSSRFYSHEVLFHCHDMFSYYASPHNRLFWLVDSI